MKELKKLEHHISEANRLLSETNWLFYLHPDSIKDIRDLVDTIRCETLKTFFHSNDLKDAIHWFINEQKNERK